MLIRIVILAVGFHGVLALADPNEGVKSVTEGRIVPGKIRAQVAMDCSQASKVGDGTQECLRFSVLKLSLDERKDEDLRFWVSVNPFARMDSSYDRYGGATDIPAITTSPLAVFDRFGFAWEPRKNLEVAVGDYRPFRKIPDTSGLVTASQLDPTGWRQMAISLTYQLPVLSGMRVQLSGGNGEGEPVENLDPQQYFAFEMITRFFSAVETNFGISFDGNSAGSLRTNWYRDSLANCVSSMEDLDDNTGYSTSRIYAGAMLNGRLAAVRGLKLGAGWERVKRSDLSKTGKSTPSTTDLAPCDSLDPGELFVEDSANSTANTVTHTTFGLNGSYRILDRFSVGVDYQTRRIDTGVVKFFEPCDRFEGKSCHNRGQPTSRLVQSTLSYGVGFALAEALTFTLEYRRFWYDRYYNKFRFEKGSDGVDKTTDVIFGRLAYDI